MQKKIQNPMPTTNIVPISTQLSLFEISSKEDDKYSQSIEIYDALPKHTLGQCEFELDQAKAAHNAIQVRQCVIRKETFTVKIRPALIERLDRSTRKIKVVLRYPSEREDIVESALRKLAVNGQLEWITQNEIGAGVEFSLYELQQELKKTGHNYNLTDIKESITVMSNSTLEISNEDGSVNLTSPFLPMSKLVDKKTFKNSKSMARCLCQFHPLITLSILALNYRYINYKLLMSLRNHLARHMFRRMTHFWVQASPNDPYTPRMMSFLQQSPRGVSDVMADNTRAMRRALEELESKGVTSKILTYIEKKGNAITDIKYEIYPTDSFIRDQKRANKIARDIKRDLIDKDR